MTTVYYHNPRCSKSRQGLELLEKRNLKFKIKEYLKDGFSSSELEDIFKKLGKSPDQVIRKKEKLFVELELKGKTLDHGQWIATIVQNPALMERPILVTDSGAAIGRPPEDLLTII